MMPLILLLAGAVIAFAGYRTGRKAGLDTLMHHILIIGVGVIVMIAGIIWAFVS